MSFTENFRHYLILISVGYILGLLFAAFINPISVFYALIFICVFITVIFIKIIISIFAKHKFSKLMTLSILFLIPFVIGNVRLSLWNYNSLKILRPLRNDNAIYTAKITTLPYITKYNKVVANAYVFKITNNKQSQNVRFKVHLTFNKSPYQDIKYGDTVKFYGKYSTSDDSYFVSQKAKNCVAEFSVNNLIKVYDEDIPKQLSEYLFDIGVFVREKILYAIDDVYSYNSESAGIIKAIITGDRNDFTTTLYTAFSRAGFMHVAAISGMHISILFTILSFILQNLRFNRKFAILISSVVIIIFSATAAFTPSVLRAAIMLIISMFSFIVNKEYDSKTALFLSALIILLIYPFAVLSPGFLLSFGATLGLIVFFRYFSNRLKNIFNEWSKIFMIDSISISLSAFLGTAPFLLLFFGELSFWSILTNIWIVPIVTVVFCISLISCVSY